MKITKQRVFAFSLLLTILFIDADDCRARVITAMTDSPLPEIMSDDPYQSRLFRVRGTPKLLINTISGDISVVQTPGINGVQVDLYVERSFSLWSGTRSLDNFRIIMRQQGDQIIASVEDRRSGPPGRRADVQFHFIVQVPEDAITELRTVNGSITLEGVKGQHFLQNQTGDLVVKQAEGEVRAVSSTGNISLEQLNGNIFAKNSKRRHPD
jgi:hypothetical protein